MEKPLISVIVPIYNVEDYLDRCVKSIVNQTYNYLEIILVDDGSPDNCPQLCDDWVKKDNRIKVIHKENGGLSDARNAGMKIAAGKYIGFIDSDDFVAQDFFETLLSVMQKENSDIVECGVVKFYEDGSFEEHSDDLAVVTFETESALSGLIAENPFHQHVWNKLYKTQLVNDIPYAVGKLNEDEFWTYQVFGRAQKVSKINKTMYYYFQRSSSIMGEGYNIRRLDALEGKVARQEYIEEYYPELSLCAKLNLYESMIFACQCTMKYLSGADKRKALSIIRLYLKSFHLSMKEVLSTNSPMKTYFIMSKVNFMMCCRVRNLFEIGF